MQIYTYCTIHPSLNPSINESIIESINKSKPTTILIHQFSSLSIHQSPYQSANQTFFSNNGKSDKGI